MSEEQLILKVTVFKYLMYCHIERMGYSLFLQREGPETIG